MTDIVGKRFWFFLISAIIVIPGVVSLALPPHLRPGIDFSAGTNMTLSFTPQVDESDLRGALAAQGYGNAAMQRTGEGAFIVRLPQISSEEATTLQNNLAASLNAEVKANFAVVSPIVAASTARNAAIAVFVASVFILAYISWAFRKMPNPFRWGACAIFALLHDVLIVLGIFSLLGRFGGVEIDSLFITAMLTVAGYAVHDTIVVFDRIRENLVRRVGATFEETVNYSILQTLARSLNTSVTTLFVLTALFFLGGATIQYFVLALIIGIVAGTYGSLFNAAQFLVVWENNEWGRFLGKKKAAVPAS